MQDRDLFRVYIRSLKWLAPVLSISYDRKTVEVDLSGQGDTAEYGFKEVEFMRCTSLHAAKSYRGESEADRLIFEGDILKDVDSTYCEVIWDKTGFICDAGNVDSDYWKDCEIIGTIYDRTEGEG